MDFTITASDYESISKAETTVYSWWTNFIAGGTALSVSFAIMHPLDTYKTLLQSNIKDGQLLKKMSLTRLTKGLYTSALPAFPQGGLRFATYELAKEKNIPGVLAVVLADISSSVIKVPRELVTSRLQTSTYETVTSVTRSILKTDGILGLFKGFWTTSARDWPFMIILFTTYEKFNHFHAQFDTESSVYPIIYGGISGAFAAFLTTPFDVLRTRIMTDKGHGTTGSFVLKNLLMPKTVNNQPRLHLKPLFAGSVSRSVWWFFVCSMFFPMYESVQKILDNKQPSV